MFVVREGALLIQDGELLTGCCYSNGLQTEQGSVVFAAKGG